MNGVVVAVYSGVLALIGMIGTVLAVVSDNVPVAAGAAFTTAALGLFTLMWNTYRKEIKRLTTKCARAERVGDLLLTELYRNNIPVPEEVRILQGVANGAASV